MKILWRLSIKEEEVYVRKRDEDKDITQGMLKDL